MITYYKIRYIAWKLLYEAVIGAFWGTIGGSSIMIPHDVLGLNWFLSLIISIFSFTLVVLFLVLIKHIIDRAKERRATS